MSRSPRPLPPELGALFTPAQAREWGVSAGRLRACDLEQPFRGVHRVRPERTDGEGRGSRSGSRRNANTDLKTAAGTLTPPDHKPKHKPKPESEEESAEPFASDRAQRERVLRLAEAYLPVMPEHAFFAGRTALVVYELPVEHPADLDVAVFPPHRAPRRRGVRGRKASRVLTDVRIGVRDGRRWRVASAVSAWAMLAPELSVRELIVIGDALVRVPRDDSGRERPQQALATLTEIRAAVEAGQRPHQRRLRLAVQSIRVGSASPLETDYRLDAQAAGLPEPELDVEVFDAQGRRIGITEVAYREWKVLVEVEGDQHRVSRKQWNRDIEKYAAYVAEG